MRRSRFFVFALLAVIATGLFLVLDGCSSEKGKNADVAMKEMFPVINEAYNIIQENTVYQVEGDRLIEGALRGMADTIGDPYSTYLSKEEAASHRESLAGEKLGIGAEITRSGGKYIIVAPVKGSPAEKAGLQPYDEIVRINGEPLGGMTLQDVVKKIKGKEGTTVSLTIYRPDLGKHLELKVMRDVIPVKTVSAELMEERGKKFGYIALTMFGDETAAEWKKATDDMIAGGAEALIIDVRGNPGGYLRAVAKVAGSLLPDDSIFAYMQNAQGQLTPLVVEPSEKFSYDKKLKNIPVVLLQDKGSASASEVLSGALKDLRRGFIIGKVSFGKGTVQDTMELSNGGEMKLTTHKWLTPKETWIHGKGVNVDLESEQDKLFTEHIRFSTEVYAEGDYHEDISYAQKLLVGLGYAVDREDGYFDESTALAVHAFRVDSKIPTENIMDRKFFASLRERVENYRKDKKNDVQLQVAIGYVHHLLSN
ncbi:S41 family peptidase [Sporosarcina thermotolerans]|uniref:S41 family peptidase n=1 Tax=Sporosarcina thermotolerans TaxID=633404 RepID=A0AAW9AD03_9BACL|nr:S41 family peptidase [Sporosarcina thermotolerans]MDW0116988.1 S41 family peptidase [Sporosarcina thermotolerans]